MDHRREVYHRRSAGGSSGKGDGPERASRYSLASRFTSGGGRGKTAVKGKSPTGRESGRHAVPAWGSEVTFGPSSAGEAGSVVRSLRELRCALGTVEIVRSGRRKGGARPWGPGLRSAPLARSQARPARAAAQGSRDVEVGGLACCGGREVTRGSVSAANRKRPGVTERSHAPGRRRI